MDVIEGKNVNLRDDESVTSNKHHRVRMYRNYNVYIKKLVGDICANYRIKRDSNNMFNIIIDAISTILIQEANKILVFSKRTNMSEKDIMTAVLLLFPDVLALECIEYAKKSIEKYTKYIKADNNPISKQSKAGLKLPVSRLRTKIQEHIIKHKHIGEKAPVFLAGVLECIVVKILEPSCGETSRRDVITINNEHIRAGISRNPQLGYLLTRAGLYFCNNQITSRRVSFKYRNKLKTKGDKPDTKKNDKPKNDDDDDDDDDDKKDDNNDDDDNDDKDNDDNNDDDDSDNE